MTPNKQVRVLYGGRGSTKSWDAGRMALNLSCVCMGNVLCLRQHQNKIAHSVYKLLKTQIINEGVADLYDILQNTITHRLTGSEFTFLGIARNIEEIKSTEDVDIIWIEEAEAVTEEQWDIIDPLARKQGAQIWIVFNP
ncbi:phage terminase large subunit, partial [Candidatus Pacearchaeota archaeon]|nr:phage terminase large subunit [Candidatus Pacearchaeota archaeon]